MKLNTDTKDIIKREFPWLVFPENMHEFFVKRIEPGFLEKTSCGYETQSGHWYPSGWIKFFDSKGKELFEVGQTGIWKEKRVWTLKWPFLRKVEKLEDKFFKETIGDALFRLGPATRNVHYVVSVLSWSSPYTVILYKPAKGFGIKEWYERVLKKAEAELIDQINEIDAEAT